MKLAEFIRVEMERILTEWEAVAAAQLPAAVGLDVLALRDHAREILLAVTADIVLTQSDDAQAQKSKGLAPRVLNAPATAAQTHAALRSKSGFDVNQLFCEYRALRASVLRLWADASAPGAIDLQEMIRFNEAIDQAVAESVATFTERADAARALMAGMFGHDMRTPLNAIAATTACLERVDAGPVVQAATQRLANSSALLAGLIDDFHDINRSQLGLVMSLERTLQDAAAVCAQEIEQQRAAQPARDIALQVVGDARGSFDAVRLRRLVGNLLSNALKYSTPGSRVQVVVQGSADEVEIRVVNRGRRIDAAELRLIFDPLRRGALLGASPAHDHSLGLGLYICREIALAHGGSIDACSDDAATVFAARLPREVSEPARAQAPPVAAIGASAQRRILMADDNEDARESLALLMTLEGHDVHVAADGTAAYATAERIRPDVAVLDIGMPGLNGYEVAAAIRAAPWGRGMLLIALTGWGKDEDRARSASAGFDHHLTKPADVAHLFALVAHGATLRRDPPAA